MSGNSPETGTNAETRSGKDLSIATSKQDFESFIRGFTHQNKVDPNHLQDSIDSYTDRFDRLKFLFLEQEAKEQFLRLVLEQNNKHIDRDEILKSVEEGEKLKEVLNDKKRKIGKLSLDIETRSKEVHASVDHAREIVESVKKIEKSNQENSAELKAINDVLERSLSDDPLEQELEKFRNTHPDSSVDLTNLRGLDINTLRELVRQANDLKLDLRAKNDSLQYTKDETEKKIKQRNELLDSLVKRNKELDELIEKINVSNSKENKEVIAKRKALLLNEEKLRVLHQLWTKISNVSSFKFEDSKVLLRYKKFPEDECSIKLTDTEAIESIEYSLIDKAELNAIKEKANRDKIPLSKASELIYNNVLNIN